MSSNVAIKVEGLSKCYPIYDAPIDRLKQFVFPKLQNIFGIPSKGYYREFWALKNISFEVKKGEVVGIVGRNGSGKSTLLQIICGVLNPTVGRVDVNGRIAALLELGSGFNPEFTGRENIYLNASVLGLNKNEIDAKFDEIVGFAEMADFIDQQVKTYSSGMVMRLAFAVAVHVDPEILVVDEALSVGDERFQRKCFSLIEKMRSAGATILFVSHSGGTVIELCDRAILIDAGENIAYDLPKKIVAKYHKLLYAPNDRRNAVRDGIRSEYFKKDLPINFGREVDVCDFSIFLEGKKDSSEKVESVEELSDGYDIMLKPSTTIAYEACGAIIESPAIYTADGEMVNNLVRGNSYRYCYTVRFLESAANVRFGMLIKTVAGVELGGAISAVSSKESLPFVAAGSLLSVTFDFCCRLNPGVYFLNAGVLGDIDNKETYLHRLIDVAMFRVVFASNNLSTGMVDFSCVPNIEMK